MYLNLFNNILLINHGLGNTNTDTKYTPSILKHNLNRKEIMESVRKFEKKLQTNNLNHHQTPI